MFGDEIIDVLLGDSSEDIKAFELITVGDFLEGILDVLDNADCLELAVREYMSKAVHIIELHLMAGMVLLLRNQAHKHQGYQVEQIFFSISIFRLALTKYQRNQIGLVIQQKQRQSLQNAAKLFPIDHLQRPQINPVILAMTLIVDEPVTISLMKPQQDWDELVCWNSLKAQLLQDRSDACIPFGHCLMGQKERFLLSESHS